MKLILGSWVLVCIVVYVGIQSDPVSFFSRQTVKEYEVIEDVREARVWYGNLNEFPHTYTFTVTESTPFYAEIRMPTTQEERDTVSLILIKIPIGNKRVTEIGRVRGPDTVWETQFDIRRMEWYRYGPKLETILEPGTYRFEVHSANNHELYAVRLGTEAAHRWSYIAFVSELWAIHRFTDSFVFLKLATPAVVVPMLALLGTVYYWRRRREVVID